MDRLTSLTAFVQVVDGGGFSAAGRRLKMSTMMVSNHVQALEDRLGARLLHRTTRKVGLTEVGNAYYDRCTQILADLEQADEFAGALQSTPRIYTATHIVPLVAPAVAVFLASYPDVKVDLTMGERTIDLIDEGFDLAVRLAPPPDSSLVVRSLATWRHVLCCSPAYLGKYGPPRQLSELAERNCVRHVSYPYGDDWHFVDRNGMPASVRLAGNLVTNAPRGLLAPQRKGAMCHFRAQGLDGTDRSVPTMSGWHTKINIVDQGRRHRWHLFPVRVLSHIRQRVVKNSVRAAAWQT
jgi:DNA-binding transcriptional LysR family regulator